MTSDEVFRSATKLTLQEAKKQICRLFFNDVSTLSIHEENDCFFPQLAAWAKQNMPGTAALQVMETLFLPFDPKAQKREARILEVYLKQLGS